MTLQQIADISGIKHRQQIDYYLRTASIKGAEIFAKAFDVEPKDLIV